VKARVTDPRSRHCSLNGTVTNTDNTSLNEGGLHPKGGILTPPCFAKNPRTYLLYRYHNGPTPSEQGGTQPQVQKRKGALSLPVRGMASGKHEPTIYTVQNSFHIPHASPHTRLGNRQ